ncbi:ribosomal protein S5-alanine N-acetyltransferase [Parasalinivibrio latis]|uniref:ribosomal protein S5-alanine N-acetyltransferase n=1 Tax=Parasalinivibrio latis TaxID=2952610 RepID=UPI0030E4EF7B
MFEESINANPVLTVDELTIKAIGREDAINVAAYFRANRDFLLPWEPHREPEFYSDIGWLKRASQLSDLQRRQLSYYFLIYREGSDEVIGTISFSNFIRFPMYACYVGYSLAENMQGKGIMRRALGRTIRFMFDDLKIHRIMANYMPRNSRSEAVLTANGFTKEGVAKAYLLINGKWEDHVLTSLINPKWTTDD